MKEILLEVLVLYGCGLLYYIPSLFVVWGDVIGLLVKIFHFKKNIKGYEVQKMFLKSDEYIQHRKKWMKKFLYPLLICGLSWGFLKIGGANEALSISVSLLVLVICFCVVAGKESIARKETKQLFLDRTLI